MKTYKITFTVVTDAESEEDAIQEAKYCLTSDDWEPQVEVLHDKEHTTLIEKLPDTKLWTNRILVTAGSGKRYTVAKAKDHTLNTDLWMCSCPDWPRQQWCDHVELLARDQERLANKILGQETN